MKQTIYNFNAGPSALPKSALERAQSELINFQQTGMSIMEISHRSKPYEEVHHQAKQLIKELLQIPEQYDVLFLQGGASLQFTMIAMNLLEEEKVGNYLLTGSWSEKALKEGSLIGQTKIVASSKAEGYRSIPTLPSFSANEQDAYFHITSNNTIYGTQYQQFPTIKHAPLIADMSSDILSKPIDISKFGLIYAGAQKNLGPSGVTVVIIKKDILQKDVSKVPTMLRYQTHIQANSLYNTPPSFSIYMLYQVLTWVKESGGTSAMAQRNKEKAQIIYEAIDQSDGFYLGHATKDSRSFMNITFNLQTEELNKQFLQVAEEQGFIGLQGHRSVGGCRASIYNAVPLEACIALRDLMIRFKEETRTTTSH